VSFTDEALVAELVQESGADLAVEPSLETLGGLVLESGDGRVARNTFEERLSNAEPRLRLWYGCRLSELTGEER
jgi:vacuolar-type H+-ATPase subunit E/Vma4